ncbi:MAG TPA: hypothetical protein VEY51_10820, partial [Chondromyces sp.]|nr:hypothetical protein [Chondromyces sp.]
AASWTFGGEALMEVSALIALEGKNPWELLTLPTASIRKLGWDEETLSRYGEKKIVRRFSSRKKEK